MELSLVISLLQRVSHAKVSVNHEIISRIDRGILALIGIEKQDTEKEASLLLDKIFKFRIFEDTNEKMNLNLKDVAGGLLLVSQFTLVADTKSGTRPGFSTAMAPDKSKKLFEHLIFLAKNQYPNVATGLFGADMQINLCNDGPVTFILKI